MTTAYRADTKSTHDYYFAWRWLLPLNESSVLYVRSLPGDQQQWWQQHFATVSQPGQANGLLMSLDNASHDELAAAITTSSIEWIAAWGHGSNVQALASHLHGFSSIRCYALLPAAMPRVVVPLSSPAATLVGLRLHRPGRRLARLAMIIAAWLARFGSFHLLQKQLLLVACRNDALLPAGLQQVEDQDCRAAQDFALYLGTPEPNRKTVVLPLMSGPSERIIKAADNPLGCTALRNEAAALARMANTTLHAQVPALCSFHDGAEQVSLVQSYRARSLALPGRQHRAAQHFLSALSKVDSGHTTLCVLLEAMQSMNIAGLPTEIAALVSWLCDLPVQNQLLLHRSHGDFAPWNCIWTRQGLFVYDWEASCEQALALSDAFYYVLAPLRLIKHSEDGEKALQAIMAFTAPLLSALQLQRRDVPVYLALWLLQQKQYPALYCHLASALLKKKND